LASAWRAPLATLAAAAIIGASASPVRARLHAHYAPDTSFAGLVAQLSEAPGYFDSDNIITNEASYLHVASQLKKVGTHGGAYIGVGPDQNFSYIALIRPSVAFMFDIRRDNMLEHLLFKSLFMMSRNRLEYLCLLLGKPIPADVDSWTGKPMSAVLAYIGETQTDSAVAAGARRASNERIAKFGIPLDVHDREMIDRYRAQFITEGLDTRYSSLGRNNRFDYPSFGRLIMESDREGHLLSYAADENEFQYVRSMQLADRIIPVVGNVAGPKALKAVGAYVAAHGLVVSAFYLSNVEQYLMTRDGGFDDYAKNVKLLPHDSTSVIIRSYFGRFGMPHPLFVSAAGNLSTSLVERIDSFLRAFTAGELTNYSELVFKRYVTP
jgi:hypothetical protein